MNLEWEAIGYTASVWILPVIVAVTFHEAAHAWVAWRLGDDTAKHLNRVSFNPFKHLDLFGTIILPALMLIGSGGRMMFGFAKPVPINPANLNNPRRDMVLVAAAGPISNLGLALLAALLLHTVIIFEGDFREWVVNNLINTVWFNILLFIFNLLPIPPLDGSRIAAGILPPAIAYNLLRFERFGFLIIIGIFFVIPLLIERFGFEINIFWWLVGGPAEYIMRYMFSRIGVL